MIVLLNQGGGEGALFFTGKVLRFRSAGIALSQLCRMPPYRTHSLRKADGIWDAGWAARPVSCTGRSGGRNGEVLYEPSSCNTAKLDWT